MHEDSGLIISPYSNANEMERDLIQELLFFFQTFSPVIGFSEKREKILCS
jgi:hypothetical protein